MIYITTDKFEKCGVAVYYIDGTSYITISFSKIKEEEKK